MVTKITVTIQDNAKPRGKNLSTLGVSDVTGQKSLERELEVFRQSHIEIAKETLADELSRGFDKKYSTRVDKKTTKNLQSVKIGGTIEYNARLSVGPALIDTYTRILKKSPAVTRTFSSSNVVLFQGRIIATTLAGLVAWVEAVLPTVSIGKYSKVRFVNLTPYARSLERKGITAGRTRPRFKNKKAKDGSSSSSWIPSGVYTLVHRAVRSRYAAQIAGGGIRFGFMSYTSLGLTSSPMSGSQPSGSPWRFTFKKDGRPYVVPTITFSLTGKGVSL